MDTSKGTEKHRSYQDSTHAECRGGNFGASTSVPSRPKSTTEILEWISTVPYASHHMRISDDRLAGTGEWILKKEKYRTWRESNDSILLLLQGIPGTGKTYIASQVIDWFLSNTTAESRLAYFYCNRAEECRRDPESILRTLIRQLAQTPSEDNLLKPVLSVYKDREKAGQLSSRLTLRECQDLLVQLMAVYPQTTICIDALDEVDHKVRLELLKALKYVVERSATMVKIFATTRMDIDILMEFEMFPRIELEPDGNVDDINRFVEEKIQDVIERKQLLHGNVPDPLKDEICQVLRERSKGMFQLAALQITLLCDMVTPDDVRSSLKVLPETLTDVYGEIYNRIRHRGGHDSQIALNAFRWVQCSYEPLQSETLLDAVAVEIDGSGAFSRKFTAVSATDLLKACQNLLILDERLNVFRFAHISVEEYLETQQPKVDSDTEIAKICLSLVCSSKSWTGYDTALVTWEGRYHDRHLLLYSAVFWPWHLKRCNDSCQILDALWEAFLSEATFYHWIEYHRQRVKTTGSTDTFWLRSKALQEGGRDRLSTVCVFGLGRKFPSISKSQFGWMASIKPNFTTFISESAQRDSVVRSLLCASTFGDLDIAQLLLDAGADVSAADRNGWTPLHNAANNGHEAVARLLLSRGADVLATDPNGWTPLYNAAKNGHEAVARLLLDRGADVSATDSNGWTPLHNASNNGHEAVARLLLDRAADVSATDPNGWTPLYNAAKNGHEAVARLLLDRAADVSATDHNGWTPLHNAANNGHEAVARLLLDRGADVSATDHNGWTPLHNAANNGHEAVARLLLDRGADVSAAERNGWTPLHNAANNGHEAVAGLLLDRGADVSATDRNGWTPLHNAANNGHEAVARLLLDRGANVSAAECDGWTPLHNAAKNGHEKLARLLLYRGASVSAGDNDGWTPLHVASASGNEGVARLLIDMGADFAEAADKLLTGESSDEHSETAAGNARHITDSRLMALPHLQNCLHNYVFDLDVERQIRASQCPVDSSLEGRDAAFFANPEFVNYEQQTTLDHEIRQIFRRIWKPMPDIVVTDGPVFSAVVCYALAADARDSYTRIHKALDDVVVGIEKCNARGFSCDSFTILTRSSRNAVKLTRVSISTVYMLQDALKHPLDLERVVSELLRPLGLSPYGVLEREGLDSTQSNQDCLSRGIHMAAILAQIFSVCLLTYTGTHSSPISNIRLGREVDSFTLTGLGGSDVWHQWQLQMTRQKLACFGDMIGGPVWVVHQLEAAGSFGKPSHLVASLEDIADTWGRVYLEKSPEGDRFLGFRIGGGLVRPLDRETSSYDELAESSDIPCHWERSLPSDSAPLPPTTGIGFGPADLLCIGALSENTQCTFDEVTAFRGARLPFLIELRPDRTWWRTEELTAQVQAGQYLGGSIGGVKKRVGGITLKAAIWDDWCGLKDITRLAARWGLQLSLCTGAARRVCLKELFRGKVINFAAAMKPQEWSRIMDVYQHIFVGTTVSEFCARANTLRQTNSSDYHDLWVVCNVALSILHLTGPTAGGDTLKIWWPSPNEMENETLGLRVDGNWATLFKDNPDQAVFAVATPSCLCLGNRITCRESWSWDYSIHYLETTVAVDWTCKTRRSPPPPSGHDWILEGSLYALGEGFLVVSRGGVNQPGLSAQWIVRRLIPERLRRKYVKRYLRELALMEPLGLSWELLVSLEDPEHSGFLSSIGILFPFFR